MFTAFDRGKLTASNKIEHVKGMITETFKIVNEDSSEKLNNLQDHCFFCFCCEISEWI